MKIGMVTDSLGHLEFDRMLDTAASLGIQGLEFNACNWTSAPHLNLKELVRSSPARKSFSETLAKRQS
jgi:sugar phosphate isomerase/epimerase